MRLRLIFLAAVSATAIAGPAGAEPFVPADNQLVFDVIRNGKPIGDQRLIFQRDGARLLVRNTIKIVVRFVIIPVYRYEESTRTVWLDERLESHSAEVDDNGSVVRLSITDGPDGLLVDGPEGRATLPRGLKVGGFWNRDLVNENALIDSTEGTLNLYSVAPRVRETIEIGGRWIAAWRYTFRGDVEAAVWYYDSGRLLRIKRVVRDGSTVLTDLRL